MFIDKSIIIMIIIIITIICGELCLPECRVPGRLRHVVVKYHYIIIIIISHINTISIIEYHIILLSLSLLLLSLLSSFIQPGRLRQVVVHLAEVRRPEVENICVCMMYVCVYVYVYVRMYVCIYTYIYTHMYIVYYIISYYIVLYYNIS